MLKFYKYLLILHIHLRKNAPLLVKVKHLYFYKCKAFLGQFLTQLLHKIHSVAFFLFLELSNMSTFIGQDLIHFLQLIHLSLSRFTLINAK